jgi:hypothetical protein
MGMICMNEKFTRKNFVTLTRISCESNVVAEAVHSKLSIYFQVENKKKMKDRILKTPDFASNPKFKVIYCFLFKSYRGHKILIKLQTSLYCS